VSLWSFWHAAVSPQKRPHIRSVARRSRQPTDPELNFREYQLNGVGRWRLLLHKMTPVLENGESAGIGRWQGVAGILLVEAVFSVP
jgi:hypothetical protein